MLNRFRLNNEDAGPETMSASSAQCAAFAHALSASDLPSHWCRGLAQNRTLARLAKQWTAPTCVFVQLCTCSIQSARIELKRVERDVELHWEETVCQCDSKVINKRGGGGSREMRDGFYQEGFQSAVLSKWRNGRP